ncbi:cell division protein FtsQ/DivIB [Mangrovimonas xylaniphaga]|uniref:cell division protein FtsQ/DivIB n=1 Tax=Mangrovimonas xylaniphaga TaxID=1645915 RepID=UPI0006B5BFD0|nr:cell division protein FtsQ/DivIB [Mangrovimonas xylaniphaga]
MRINKGHIKLMILLIMVSGLFAFSSVRNAKRRVSAPQINFVGDDNLFITHQAVSKLLIQNEQPIANKPKEIIDLKYLETALNSNPLIKEAQVFMSVDGVITTEIEQKQPIARVNTNASYYIDTEGSYMPLSANYSARVPLVTGTVVKNDLQNVYKIANKVYTDEFLKQHVVEIHQNEDKSIELKFRLNDFVVKVGTLKQLDKKINNLKAFYQMAYKDKTLDSYRAVNLKFDNQVICTKK